MGELRTSPLTGGLPGFPEGALNLAIGSLLDVVLEPRNCEAHPCPRGPLQCTHRARAFKSSRRTFQIRQHLLVVPLWLDLLEDVLNFSIRGDDEGRSRGAEMLLSVHALFLPHAVLLADRVVRIRQQREVQLELVAELLNVRDRIRTDSK